MTKTITTAVTPATLTEQIDFMLIACSDYGVTLTADNADALLSSIDDPEVAADQLEELARLVRLQGAAAERNAA